MGIPGRRRALGIVLASVLAASSCSHDEGELRVDLAGNPTIWLFQSHTIPVGFMVQLEVVIEEAGGAPVQLDHVQLTALDRGTSQASNVYVLQREDLDREASSSLGPHGRITVTSSVGILPRRPIGPVAVLVEVQGTDGEGNPVSAVLNRDFPLGP